MSAADHAELTVNSWARCALLLEDDERAHVLRERKEGPSAWVTGRLARTRCALVQLGRNDAWMRHCYTLELADEFDRIDAEYAAATATPRADGGTDQ